MKVAYFTEIIDSNNKTRLRIPAGTLLDKIIDEWSLIIEYYENFYPFAVGDSDINYRPVTRSEFSTEKFIRLLTYSHKNSKIKKLCYYTSRVLIEGYSLCIDMCPIYFSICRNSFIYYDGFSFNSITDAQKIILDENKPKMVLHGCNEESLLVLSHIDFN